MILHTAGHSSGLNPLEVLTPASLVWVSFPRAHTGAAPVVIGGGALGVHSTGFKQACITTCAKGASADLVVLTNAALCAVVTLVWYEGWTGWL